MTSAVGEQRTHAVPIPAKQQEAQPASRIGWRPSIESLLVEETRRLREGARHIRRDFWIVAGCGLRQRFIASSL